MDDQPDSHVRLARRRQQLIAIGAVQRQSLSIQVHMWRGKLQTVGQAFGFLGRMRENPWIIGALAAVVIILKPSRIKATVVRTHTLWQRVMPFLPLVAALFQRDKAK
jgi:hypothetical protein